MNKKLIILSVVTLLLTVFVVGLYSFFKPLDTKNWNTYSSDIYNYSIKYPNGWETFGYGVDSQDDPPPGGGGKDYQERYFQNPKKESKEILLKVWLFNPQRLVIFKVNIEKMPLENKDIEEVLVDGVKALKVVGDPPPTAGVPVDQKNRCNKWIYSILVKLNKKYLCLSNRHALAIFSKGEYIYILQTEGIDFKTFDAILDSFRFLK